MPCFTRYLATMAAGVNAHFVQVSEASPVQLAQDAIGRSVELRYSPIMLAFLTPREPPPAVPCPITSVTLVFSPSPYRTLGALRPLLRSDELRGVYFTLGLASLVLLNFGADRTDELADVIGRFPQEHWPLVEGKVGAGAIITKLPRDLPSGAGPEIELPSSLHAELKVYTEQIAASLQALWASYGVYFHEERETLRQIVAQTFSLIQHHTKMQSLVLDGGADLVYQKKSNAIRASLVEICAALSYAVTQGTSGALPVLSNRSPFPHHSLLGIGGAVRALTKYTRYLESAFAVRSASKVITERYAGAEHVVPASLPGYASGPEYKFGGGSNEEPFDSGGEYPQKDNVPLIAHFSLRHGFMESKFSVTAASEALTAESLPPWTLMTLSHEIMHSRVRSIFQALFGKTWDDNADKIIGREQFDEFSTWIEARQTPTKMNVRGGLRNLVLQFCNAIDSVQNPVKRENVKAGQDLSMDRLAERYARNKYLAIEIFVHFHDYYFVYACQPKAYLMSVWASWIKVAGPYARPLEYLTRSLATVACGTGLAPSAAFDQAKEFFLDAVDGLAAGGIKSPLFGELRDILSKREQEARAYFQPCYYLIDNVGRFFASRKIVANIDRLDEDPFAEGSTSADAYSANIYVLGEGESISPIRYSLASLVKTLKNDQPIADAQWLSAWNYMVIASQEAKK